VEGDELDRSLFDDDHDLIGGEEDDHRVYIVDHDAKTKKQPVQQHWIVGTEDSDDDDGTKKRGT
jgi:hypothetical protein